MEAVGCLSVAPNSVPRLGVEYGPVLKTKSAERGLELLGLEGL